jgi:hypothetical protein
MIINPEMLENYYVCNRKVMEYLLYDCLIPPQGYKGDLYYFYKDEKLEECLKKMPLYLKIFNFFIKKEE